MKMAPLIYWQIAKNTEWRERKEQIELLTRMTHNNDLSVVVSLVHAAGLEVLLTEVDDRHDLTDINFRFLLNYVASKARDYERMYPEAGSKTSYILGEMALDGAGLTHERIRMYCPGGGFRSPETLGMVYGHLALTAAYPEVVLETVNSGGDTDSTASIVSTMVLFGCGHVDLPEDSRLLKDKEQLAEASSNLTAAALRNKKGVI